MRPLHLLLLLALATAAAADPITLFAEKRLISPATEQVTFDLPAVPAGQQVRLSLKARVDTPTFGGHNPFLAVAVNGQTVQPTQLVNKPVEFTMYDGSDASWWGGGLWRLLYSPGFDAFFKDDPPQYMIADADPYGFVWDITPYVKTGANTLTLSHPKLLITPTTCVVGDVKVETGAPLPPPTTGGAAAGKLTDVYEPSVARPVAMEVTSRLGGGEILVAVGGRSLDFRTLTGQPDGQWVYPPSRGAVRQLQRGQTLQVTWTGTGYKVSRSLTVLADHIRVADQITNTTDHVIGVPVQHRLALRAAQPQRLLGGRPVFKAEQTSWSPGNPTAMAVWPDLAVALVAEDDILRVHNESFSEADGIGLSDMKLGFAPGASHTLEWSIYPVPRGNYWDVINAIRRNWGCNDITIPGPSCIENPDGKKSAEELGRWAMNRTLAFAIAGQQNLDDGKLAEGTAIPLGTRWNDSFRAWSQKLRQTTPGFKALTYLHSEISTEPDCQTKYADCRVLDAAGQQQVSPYYYPVYLFIPTLDNAYGPALMKTVEFMLDDLQADGIYNDCFTYDTAAWTWGGQWDGCTIAIDPQTHAVGEKYSSVVLLQQPWKVQLARAVHARGKLLTGNGPLFTRTMLAEKVPTFTETNSFSFLIDTHLSCPWGLGTHSAEQNTATRAYMARRMLDYGGVYSVYAWGDDPPAPTFIQHFSPTTVTEIRPGVVIARERILTNRSGRFGWGDASRAEVHVYDAQGQAVTRPAVKEVRQGGKVLTEVQVPPNGFAALVRKR